MDKPVPQKDLDIPKVDENNAETNKNDPETQPMETDEDVKDKTSDPMDTSVQQLIKRRLLSILSWNRNVQDFYSYHL